MSGEGAAMAAFRAAGMEVGRALAQAGAPTGLGYSKSMGRVVSVSDGETCNVAVKGGTVYGAQYTSACRGMKPGDRVVVETIDYHSVVTGVIATPANRPVPDTRRLVYCLDFGTTVFNFTNDVANLYTFDQFREKYGRNFRHGNDVLVGMNGDTAAQRYMQNVTAFVSRDAIGFYATGQNGVSGAARITWALLTNLPVEG